MTPEDAALIRVAQDVRWKRLPTPMKPGEIESSWLEQMHAAALAYARPIVAEECARIADRVEMDEESVPWILKLTHGRLVDYIREQMKRTGSQIAAAIREHGKEK